LSKFNCRVKSSLVFSLYKVIIPDEDFRQGNKYYEQSFFDGR
jgi:hypothetical protein